MVTLVVVVWTIFPLVFLEPCFMLEPFSTADTLENIEPQGASVLRQLVLVIMVDVSHNHHFTAPNEFFGAKGTDSFQTFRLVVTCSLEMLAFLVFVQHAHSCKSLWTEKAEPRLFWIERLLMLHNVLSHHQNSVESQRAFFTLEHTTAFRLLLIIF